MRKIGVAFLTLLSLTILISTNACKTSDTVVDAFGLTATTGYSKNVTTVDPDDTGLTSLNFFSAIRNYGEKPGMITGWSYKILHNIVTLVEINHLNYQDYRLTITGNTHIPVDEISEFYVSTPQPFQQNALTQAELSFDPYTPTEIVTEIEITSEDGEVYVITGRGSFTYEKGVVNESRYDILGNWELKRVVNGDAKSRQRIAFVGTKYSGNYVIYGWGGNNAEETGSYAVSNYKYVTFTSSLGSKYWGEFTGESNMTGTLMIPESRNQDTQTGTWTAKKL